MAQTAVLSELDPSEHALVEILLAEEYSMLSPERAFALLRLAREVEASGIPGALVDCGVWNGGSTVLLSRGAPSRSVWAFDSFQGLPEPGPHDGAGSAGFGGAFCGSETRVREAFARFGSPERLHVVGGWFEDTLAPAAAELGPIAVLHVDCDWYAPVKLVLETLYPLVSPGGYVVIDDYGFWPGAALATEEFRREHAIGEPLIEIDSSGRFWRRTRSESRTTVDLTSLSPLHARVGFGSVGMHGDLGYEGKRVSVQGVAYASALSTHAPARLLYYLGGGCSRFTCGVALNDDVPAGWSSADFTVLVDGREVASQREVWAGQAPRAVEASIAGGHLLELLVSTSRWAWCHAVWLDPAVDGEPLAPRSETIIDPLGRVEIQVPPELPIVERCIATIASPGWEDLLDDLLGSIAANGGCPDALVAVLVIGGSEECERIVAKHRALPIRCRPLRPATMASKAALYSIARLVAARRYLCLDADMLVFGSVEPLFAAIDAVPEGSVLACGEANTDSYRDLDDVLRRVYGGRDGDIQRILGGENGEGAYPLTVNDGTFVGSREALLALDGAIRAMPGAIGWIEDNRAVAWRNQFVFNLALAHLRCGIELDERYNLQLHGQNVQVDVRPARPEVTWQGRQVRILHANGWGRQKYPELRGLYARVEEPLGGRGDGDLYAQFLEALRAWVGRRGVGALAWTSYGTPNDEPPASVRDPSMLPVLAQLHYLVRASGASRVLETGTARGISSACLASAVAHREDARVVTLDTTVYPEREELWGALPEPMRSCIEARTVDALDGLRAAARAGERYDVILLDPLHTDEDVLAELELSLRLLSPRAPILVHDWLGQPRVARALERAEAAGFSVVRLFGGEGAGEENGNGLAIVQPRDGGSGAREVSERVEGAADVDGDGAPATGPQLSVVLTCNRFVRRLRLALRNWCEQELPAGALEILVVNPESPDDTAEHLAAVARETRSVEVREVRVAAALGTNKGAMINAALEQVRGGWVWIADADCLFAPDAAREALRQVAEAPQHLHCVRRRHLSEAQTDALLEGAMDSIADFGELARASEGVGWEDEAPWGYTQLFERSLLERVRYRDDVNSFARTDEAFIDACGREGYAPRALSGILCLHLAHPFAWHGTDEFL
jgi:predicted O-methyltransferase YrrM